jgi:hypothetical protein
MAWEVGGDLHDHVVDQVLANAWSIEYGLYSKFT